ncbi:oligosaccharide flippase family protein [Paracrocinitomix mangrovi]|uniref:oligosaccharide flippase family protein n=1 Tax=Paracrocinitomix mangrovi TaxID=2862509 RepID=UPI001C8DC7B1|nr:oligosaccharide flippase family protein [Paracrocinitomix mangrovi]UKN02924.1 oligosaccharide flippase family protein [Paracrocinitomix mangrovi]
MQRKFLTSLILIVLLNFLVKPFYIIGIDAEVQNRVGEEVYGNYFSLLNFSFLLNILLDLGITNYNTRNIAQHPQLLQKHFYKILSLRMALFILYATFTLLMGLFVGYNNYQFYLLSMLMINQFLVALIQFARSNFNGLMMFKTDAFISVLDRLLLIVFCSVLLWTNFFKGEFQIEWFIYAQTLAYAIAAIIAVGLLGNRIGQIQFTMKRTFSMAIIRQSFPYALLILLMMMYSRIDAVMLERILEDGKKQAGIYAQGFRLLDAVNMFALLFAGLLLPIFARMIKEKVSLQPMVELAFKLLMSASVVTALILFWNSGVVMNWRYPDAETVSSTTFGLIILCFIPISLSYIFGTLLTANGSLKALNLMAFGGVALNVVLNLILINKMEVVGAATATIVTQILTAIVQMVIAYKIFKFKINFSLYGRLLLLVALMIAAFIVADHWFADLAGGYKMLIELLIGVALAFVLKLISIKELLGILQDSSKK